MADPESAVISLPGIELAAHASKEHISIQRRNSGYETTVLTIIGTPSKVRPSKAGLFFGIANGILFSGACAKTYTQSNRLELLLALHGRFVATLKQPWSYTSVVGKKTPRGLEYRGSVIRFGVREVNHDCAIIHCAHWPWDMLPATLSSTSRPEGSRTRGRKVAMPPRSQRLHPAANQISLHSEQDAVGSYRASRLAWCGRASSSSDASLSNGKFSQTLHNLNHDSGFGGAMS